MPASRRAGGHDRDPGRGQRLDLPGGQIGIIGPEREGVAEHDAPLHAVRPGAPTDLAQAEGTQMIGLVQMDVDRPAETLGQPEDQIQMALRVAVDRGGVEAADDVGTQAQRLLHQLGRVGPAEQSPLRERDDLDVDDPGQPLAAGEHALDAAHADLRVDVDMAANVGRAQRDGAKCLAFRLRRGVEAQPRLEAALVLDEVDDPGAAAIGLPGMAQKALVEMGVRIDQAGQEQGTAAVMRQRPLLLMVGRPDGGDPAGAHHDAACLASVGAGIAHEQILTIHHRHRRTIE